MINRILAATGTTEDGMAYMLKLRVKELLKERGRSKYWLHKRIGMSYQNFCSMVDNKTGSIRYETIELLCESLECTPNDLFERLGEEEAPKELEAYGART